MPGEGREHPAPGFHPHPSPSCSQAPAKCVCAFYGGGYAQQLASQAGVRGEAVCRCQLRSHRLGTSAGWFVGFKC